MKATSRLWAFVVLCCAIACIDFDQQRDEFCRNADPNRHRLICDLCGDGVVQPDEACDDGNIRYGDGCSADCKSNETCGNGILDRAVDEVCDDGNTMNGDRCSSDCLATEQCGNGFLDPDEYCESGGVDSIFCDNDCTFAVCGDSHTNTTHGEQCDEGSNNNDNGNCLKTCKLNVCGDGFVKSEGTSLETCDDDNTLACGTCNATCSQIQSGPATGSIIAVKSGFFKDRETFTLNDGINPPVSFEFDSNGDGVSPGHVLVGVLCCNDTDMALAIEAAINGVGSALQITAMAMVNSKVVNLRHDQPGSFGNQAITETVLYNGFSVTGMAGGAGYDCGLGVGCATSADCEPRLTCQGLGTKTCQ